ncbi:hypothetical protein XANCAGTX0491_007100 [Xanthoria calcicola]
MSELNRLGTNRSLGREQGFGRTGGAMAQLELSISFIVRYPSRASRPDRMNTAPTPSSPALGAGTNRHLRRVRERFPFDIAISFQRPARRCLSSKSYHLIHLEKAWDPGMWRQ